MIPIENATGNFTKITQRVPVRIVVDRTEASAGLRPGLSVEVKVDLKSRTDPASAETGTLASGAAAAGTPAGATR
jgi:membrane fusion protein (multidrug efflux system)